ncbi:MAG: hypothetical protein AAFR68_16595 [Pseudomonadota bacterium]
MHSAAALGRTLANRGMKLREAQALFRVLYAHNAIVAAGGNRSEAARIAGCQRANLRRMALGLHAEPEQ